MVKIRYAPCYDASSLGDSSNGWNPSQCDYIELTPNEYPNLAGEIQATIALKKVSCGTELNILQEGVPDVIPAEACYLGVAGIAYSIGETGRGRDSRLALGE
jgi:hypothetical protein